MSTTYDWSQALNPIMGLINQYSQQQQYSNLLKTQFGDPQQSDNAVNVTPKMGPGDTVAGRQAAGAYNTAPTTYSGPLGQALGPQADLYHSLLSGMSPEDGQAIWPQLLLKGADRQQSLADRATERQQQIADKTMRTLTPDELAARGYRPGTTVQVDPFGHEQVSQASDIPSAGAIKAKQDEATFTNQLPMTAAQTAANNVAAGGLAEKKREFDATNPMLLTGGAAGSPGGPAPLTSYPQGTQAMVHAMVEGRQAPPTSFALKTPYWQNMLALANSVDPSFDQTAWGARASARKDFLGGGKSYQTLNAGNTAIQHLGHLASQINDVSGVQFPLVGNLVNSGINATAKASGTPGVPAYNDTLGHLAEETTRFYRGAGGNEADVSRNMDNLSPNLSTEQKQAGIGNTVSLIYGKLAPMVEQYNKAMNTNYPTSHFLSKQAVATIQKMGYNPDTGDQAAPASANPNSPPPPPGFSVHP